MIKMIFNIYLWSWPLAGGVITLISLGNSVRIRNTLDILTKVNLFDVPIFTASSKLSSNSTSAALLSQF